jgi:nucleotide-binding universal stress UspA family protein
MSDPRQIKTVLIATGLSESSIGAVALGRRIAGRFGAALHAIHVIEPVSEAHEEAIPGVGAAHAEHAEEELRAFAEAHGLRDGAHLHTARGSAEAEILRAIKDLDADLVVVGREGRGALKRGEQHAGAGRLGSVAQRLLHKSPVSVLIAAARPAEPGAGQPGHAAREDGPVGVGGVAVATGFSESSPALVERAATLATALGRDEVTLLYAYHLPIGYHTIMSEEEANARLESLAVRRTDKLAETVAAPAGVRLRLLAGRGEPRDVVPKLAEQANTSLLVIGAHARSLPATFMLPRITEAIVRHVTCAVWAAKRPEWRQGFFDAVEEMVGG